MQRDSSLPIHLRSQPSRYFGDSIIGHAKPNQICRDLHQRDRDRLRANSLRQRPSLSSRRAAVPEHDLVDDIPGLMQRQGQSRAQIPRSNNRDPRTTSHAGQNSRSGRMQKSEVKMQK
jgi:hypothetical protein